MSLDDRKASNPAAKQVLAILDAGSYTAASGKTVSIGALQARAEAGTRLYLPGELDVLRARAADGRVPPIEVVANTTQEAAERWAEDDAVVLNFASARNPGGGFLGGARAQEEELCRCSGLYRTLLTQREYYEHHRGERTLLYSDRLIHSPGVPFFRLATKAPLLDAPIVVGVITAPAPNAGAIQRNRPEEASAIEATFERRWANILAVALEHEHRTVILGAWGCGAFRNDPEPVAEAARRVLESGRWGDFDRVVFAIPDRGNVSAANLAAFRRVLS
ncbi:MAG: TIGR02452 family protein [Deltaproteobacteria bacterium]|nr:TIGR02452 family protein [Deltaproteobacteria bacterium]